MVDRNDPIQDAEILLRRVPAEYIVDGKVRPDAFAPMKRDTDGICFYRAMFHTPEDVANFRRVRKNPCYVAHIEGRAFKAMSLEVIPDPLDASEGLPSQDGHVRAPACNYTMHESDDVINWKRALARAVLRVSGPFSAQTDTTR